MSSAVPIIRQSREGELMWFAGGGAFTWKATAAETGEAFILMEDRMEGGKVTPFHVHPDQDEGNLRPRGRAARRCRGRSAAGRPRRLLLRATRRCPRLHGHLRQRTRAGSADARDRGILLSAGRGAGRVRGRRGPPRRLGTTAARGRELAMHRADRAAAVRGRTAGGRVLALTERHRRFPHTPLAADRRAAPPTRRDSQKLVMPRARDWEVSRCARRPSARSSYHDS